MLKIGMIGAAMGLMSRFFDKVVPKAPDLQPQFHNRRARRAIRARNRSNIRYHGAKHIAGCAHAKLLKHFENGTATQRHPG